MGGNLKGRGGRGVKGAGGGERRSSKVHAIPVKCLSLSKAD